MMTALDELEARLDAMEAERTKEYEKALQKRLDGFVADVTISLQATWRKALDLRCGISDGEPVAYGVYRGISFLLMLDTDDYWAVQFLGKKPLCLCTSDYGLEEVLLSFLLTTLRPLAETRDAP